MRKITKKNKSQQLVDVSLGKNVKIYSFVNAYGCRVGDGTKIGAFVEIQKGVKIGKNCKISSHSFICEGVEIKDNVFIGHNVTFINDRYPKSTDKKGRLIKNGGWKVQKTLVEKGASIGSSATILGGVTIGEGALVGAGSVVTHNVSARATVVGVPARVLKK